MRASLLSLFWTVTALAQSLPLQGYYHPGEYMPVKLSAASETRITALQCVPTVVSPASTSQIVPFLTLGSSADVLTVDGKTLPLQPLKPNQRLVGLMDVDAAGIPELFANDEIVTVRIARADLMSAIPISFDSLDAIFCSADTFRAMDARKVDVLLNCGVTLAVKNSISPDAKRPWEVVGEYRVLRPTHKFVSGAQPREEVYQPIQSWRPQRSGEARWLIVIVSAMAAVIVLALSLLPKRLAVLSTVLFSTVASSAVWMTIRQSSARTWIASGEIERGTQGEVWCYFASADAQHFAVPLPPAGYPIPYSFQHAADLNLQLQVNRQDVSLSFDLDSARRLCVFAKGGWKLENGESIDVRSLHRLSSP